MGLKKFRNSDGHECYGISCEEAERHSKFIKKDNLRKSAPAAPAASVDLSALRRDIDASFVRLIDAVTQLGKRVATDAAAEKRFKPLQTGERLSSGADGLPVRKDIGANSARRRENVVKSEGAVQHELQPQSKNRFVPGGVEKSEEALELMKTARGGRVPATPGLNW